MMMVQFRDFAWIVNHEFIPVSMHREWLLELNPAKRVTPPGIL